MIKLQISEMKVVRRVVTAIFWKIVHILIVGGHWHAIRDRPSKRQVPRHTIVYHWVQLVHIHIVVNSFSVFLLVLPFQLLTVHSTIFYLFFSHHSDPQLLPCLYLYVLSFKLFGFFILGELTPGNIWVIFFSYFFLDSSNICHHLLAR